MELQEAVNMGVPMFLNRVKSIDKRTAPTLNNSNKEKSTGSSNSIVNLEETISLKLDQKIEKLNTTQTAVIKDLLAQFQDTLAQAVRSSGNNTLRSQSTLDVSCVKQSHESSFNDHD